MQFSLDGVKVNGLYTYALTASGGGACAILGRFLDQWGTTLYSKTYSLSTSTASSLTTLYRDVAAQPTALLADTQVYCFVADISSGSARVSFVGAENGTVSSGGRTVDVANGSFRLGPTPLVNHRILGTNQTSYTRSLSFNNVSVSTTATKIITSPAVGRRSVELYNPNSGTYLFVGYDSTVNSQTKAVRRLAPYTTTVVSAGDGLDLWVAASGAAATITYAELA